MNCFKNPESNPEFQKIKLSQLLQLHKEADDLFGDFELPTSQLKQARNLVNVVRVHGEDVFEKDEDVEP